MKDLKLKICAPMSLNGVSARSTLSRCGKNTGFMVSTSAVIECMTEENYVNCTKYSCVQKITIVRQRSIRVGTVCVCLLKPRSMKQKNKLMYVLYVID